MRQDLNLLIKPLKMSTIQVIIDFVYLATDQRVLLSREIAAGILQAIKNDNHDTGCGAKISRYNMAKNVYETIVTILLSKQDIDDLIQYSLNNKPVEKFYRYELLEFGKFAGFIYTANPSLHDVPSILQHTNGSAKNGLP